MVTRSLLIVITLCHQLDATAIALIVTPRFVVAATDSKVVDANGVAKAETCKIRKVGDIFYVANKFTSHSATGYDLNRTVGSIEGNSVTDVAAKAKAVIANPLRRAIIQSRKEDPTAFEGNFVGGQAMGVVFFGFENGAPAVVDLRFLIEDLNAADLKVKVEQHSCPGADCPGGYAYVLVPQELAAKFQAEHPRYWMGDASTVAANAEAFIDLATREKLPDVGPPVSVLVLDSLTSRWLKHGVCRP